ncbi:MAG: UDP-N-acetylglucosamine 1-carboxyvinyltransferase [Candidatus Niyogibacteria bacterium]|nr:UDP-N-acetylglucosamine 1-carboxyvinyltransferase [Candidatus Niyogibacteria bacterium]
MPKFVIQGGKTLKGKITVSGAKNHALKLLAASILFDSPVAFENIPEIEDVFRMSELLEKMGAKINVRHSVSNRETSGHALIVDPRGIKKSELDREITKRFRASIVAIGPLLGRFGKAALAHPGGCVIGERPIDIFIEGLAALGAAFKEKDETYFFEAKKLAGADFTFRVPSVTATETLMLAAVKADGKTILRNAAMEPEIPALADFLNRAGASIHGAGTATIEIDGLGPDGKLIATNAERVIPDRIEAGSLAILGALTASDLTIEKCAPEHLGSLLEHLKAAGVFVKAGPDWMRIKRAKKIGAVNVKTREYPGFPTDLQAPFCILLTQAEGRSEIFETIFDNRLEYLKDIARMGADVTFCDPHRAIIAGPTPLRGRVMESPDLRAGLAFVIAALVAEGESEIHNVYQIDRGYENVEDKLARLGASIRRVSA